MCFVRGFEESPNSPPLPAVYPRFGEAFFSKSPIRKIPSQTAIRHQEERQRGVRHKVVRERRAFKSGMSVREGLLEKDSRARGTYKLGHQGNHQVEQTNGLDEGETQNGIGEQLAAQGRVAGDALDQGSEDETDTDTGASQTNGGSAHADVLGDLDHGLGNLGAVHAAGAGERALLGGGLEQQAGGLLALDSLEGAGAGGSCDVVRTLGTMERGGRRGRTR